MEVVIFADSCHPRLNIGDRLIGRSFSEAVFILQSISQDTSEGWGQPQPESSSQQFKGARGGLPLYRRTAPPKSSASRAEVCCFISSDTSTNLRRNQLCAFVLFFVSSPRNCGRAMTLIFRTLLAVLLVGVGEFGIACSAGIRGALESAPVRDLHFLKLEFKFEG